MAKNYILFDVASVETKEKFSLKASLDKGSMTAVLNDWIEAYLRDELFTKADMIVVLSSILVDLGVKPSEAKSLIEQKMKTSLPRLRSTYAVLSGKAALRPGQLLKIIRKEKGLKLRPVAEEVSKLLGKKYNVSNVSRLETQTCTPRRKTIEPLLQVYGYTYEQFMERLERGE